MLNNLNEKFYIFDNFLTSNKHILERGDKEWDSSKIFFQLSIEHADNSPLTHGAEKFEEDGHVDWDYIRDVNRKKEYKDNALIYHLDIQESIKKSIVLDSDHILYIFKNSKSILHWQYKSNILSYLDEHDANLKDILLFEDKILSYDENNRVVFWNKNLERIGLYDINDNIINIQILKTKIAFTIGFFIVLIPFEDLNKLSEFVNDLQITPHDSQDVDLELVF